MIFLDNAATSFKKPPEVTQNMLYAVNNFANPSRGAYPASIEALKAIHACREKISNLFCVGDASRVAFTSNITESLNICADIFVRKGDTIITTIMEHNSVLRPLIKRGAELKIVGLSSSGLIDYDAMESFFKKGAKAIFITHASNLTGDMVNISVVGALCKKYGAAFVLDTAQTAGVFDINMEACGISMLCFTGHKSLLGPQGIGGICVSDEISFEPVKVGGSGTNSFSEYHPSEMPALLEAGTLNTPGIFGLSGGVDFISKTGTCKIRAHEMKLTERLLSGIANLKNIKLYGSRANAEKAPIITFNVADIDSGTISEELWTRAEIASRSGAHCSPLFHKHLGTVGCGAVRLSVSYFNTEDEIDIAINTIKAICAEIK